MGSWVVHKGWWLSPNVFEDVYGHKFKICAYEKDYLEYKDKFPIACYVQLHNDILKNIVQRDECI